MLRRDFIQSALASGLLLTSSLSLAQKTSTKYTLEGTDVYGKKLNLSDFSGMTVLVSFFTCAAWKSSASRQESLGWEERR